MYSCIVMYDEIVPSPAARERDFVANTMRLWGDRGHRAMEGLLQAWRLLARWR